MKRADSYEGLQKDIRRLKTPSIDTWSNRYSDKNYKIIIETSEFSCICPKTGLPDFANIRIEYIPAKDCVELKSFKLYLVWFRDVGIFHEHVINRITDDFVKACAPRWFHITGQFNMRGGITTTVTREYKPRRAIR